MTEQEAIEIKKYASAFNSDNSPLTIALDIAIKALEKQIPKKTIDPQEDYGTFICPNCRGLIYALDEFKTHKHCLLCGQKLDWSE